MIQAMEKYLPEDVDKLVSENCVFEVTRIYNTVSRQEKRITEFAGQCIEEKCPHCDERLWIIVINSELDNEEEITRAVLHECAHFVRYYHNQKNGEAEAEKLTDLWLSSPRSEL